MQYKGADPALSALLSQAITVYLSTFASALLNVKSERVRAFGVTSALRTKPLPKVPEDHAVRCGRLRIRYLVRTGRASSLTLHKHRSKLKRSPRLHG